MSERRLAKSQLALRGELNFIAHEVVRLLACSKLADSYNRILKDIPLSANLREKIRTFEAENRPERLRTRYWRTISGKHVPEYRNLKRNVALPPRNRILTKRNGKFCVISFVLKLTIFSAPLPLTLASLRRRKPNTIYKNCSNGHSSIDRRAGVSFTGFRNTRSSKRVRWNWE